MSDKPYIVFGRPVVDEATIEEVGTTLRGGWIGAGPMVERFEQEICSLVGARFAVAVTSCTAGLEVALRVVGVRPGDEVITTSLTFVATANAIVHAGGVPVFVDVDPVTRTIDPIAVEKALTAKTRAIVPVHLAGLPCRMDEIREIADHRDLAVVADAAHAVGASVAGRHVGALADLTVFSFGPPKIVTSGEGGMITTDDPDLARKAETFCRQGVPSGAWDRQATGNLANDLAVMAGHNYRMTDISATIGLGTLRQYAAGRLRREDIWERYQTAFAVLPLVLPPEAPPGTVHARQLYSPLVDEELGHDRDWVRQRLHGLGVGTGIHYLPTHWHPYYRDRLAPGGADLEHVDAIGRRIFSLPYSAHLSDDEVDAVIASMHKVVHEG